MVVWINNPFDFLPGEGARLQRYGLLARELVRAGHRVIWWSSDWLHLKKCRRPLPSSCSGIEKEQWLGHVEIKLIPTWPYYRNIGIRRFLSHWNYARSWEYAAIADQSQQINFPAPDLILVSMPPLGLYAAAQKLSRRFGARLIVDVQDVWPETFCTVFPGWMRASVKMALYPLFKVARAAYQGADGVSVVAPTYQSIVARKDVRVFPLGIELPAIDRSINPDQTGILRICYSGNLGNNYRLDVVLDAIQCLTAHNIRVELHIAGDGPRRKMIEKNPLFGENIQFHGLLGNSELVSLYKSCDCGIIPMICETGVGWPNKLFDYAAYGLPVINGLKGPTSELIHRYEAGWMYDVDCAESLVNTVLDIQKQGQKEIEQRGLKARQMAEECFDARVIYPRFVQWLEGEDS